MDGEELEALASFRTAREEHDAIAASMQNCSIMRGLPDRMRREYDNDQSDCEPDLLVSNSQKNSSQDGSPLDLLCEVTGCSKLVANQYLEISGHDLDVAMGLILESMNDDVAESVHVASSHGDSYENCFPPAPPTRFPERRVTANENEPTFNASRVPAHQQLSSPGDFDFLSWADMDQPQTPQQHRERQTSEDAYDNSGIRRPDPVRQEQLISSSSSFGLGQMTMRIPRGGGANRGVPEPDYGADATTALLSRGLTSRAVDTGEDPSVVWIFPPPRYIYVYGYVHRRTYI